MKQFMVHDFSTESIVLRDTEARCLEYINNHPDQELELYWAEPGERHYKHVITTEEDKDMTFQEWLDHMFYEGFDASGLSDEEYYALEDQYNQEVNGIC